jgi:ankyrin repeat protein
MTLLRAGARSDVADDWGDTPLSIAQKKGLKEVLALM